MLQRLLLIFQYLINGMNIPQPVIYMRKVVLNLFHSISFIIRMGT